MVPLFVLLAAPLVKPLRIPVLLWYTHWNPSRSLRLALPLVDVVMSVSRGSFPHRDAEAERTGHAIDVEQFAPRGAHRAERAAAARSRSAGRRAGRATTRCWRRSSWRSGAVIDARLEIRGPQLTDDERAHRRELEASPCSRRRSLRDRVRIEPPLPRDELPALLAGADALLSATQPRGSETLDKVVYEAAACEVPVLASNAALQEFLAGLPLELSFPPRDADALAERLVALAAAEPATRAETGAELRRRVVEGHSVGSWADAVAAAVARLNRE